MAVLLAWLGNSDFRASEDMAANGAGPILGAVKALAFTAVHVLSDYGKARTDAYVRWLAQQSGKPVVAHMVKLTSPTSFEEIFREADATIRKVRSGAPDEALTYHLSPGTPAMAAIWILLAKTRHPAALIESSRDHGVKEVRIPFELSAEFLPAAGGEADESLARLMQGMPPDAPAFSAIVHRCGTMKRTVAMAH